MISRIIELLTMLKRLSPSAELEIEYREEFERHARAADARINLKRLPGGAYFEKSTEIAWRRWKSAQDQNDLSL